MFVVESFVRAFQIDKDSFGFVRQPRKDSFAVSFAQLGKRKIGGDDGTSFPDRALVEQRKKIFSRNVVVKGLAAQIVYDKQRRVRQLRQTRSLRGGGGVFVQKVSRKPECGERTKGQAALCEAVADTARKKGFSRCHRAENNYVQDLRRGISVGKPAADFDGFVVFLIGFGRKGKLLSLAHKPVQLP